MNIEQEIQAMFITYEFEEVYGWGSKMVEDVFGRWIKLEDLARLIREGKIKLEVE